jgi:DDE family transposase
MQAASHRCRSSTIKRKRIEEPFGWMKTVGGLRKTRHCGRDLVEWFFVLTAAAYNLIRIPKILAANTMSASEVSNMKHSHKHRRLAGAHHRLLADVTRILPSCKPLDAVVIRSDVASFLRTLSSGRFKDLVRQSCRYNRSRYITPAARLPF